MSRALIPFICLLMPFTSVCVSVASVVASANAAEVSSVTLQIDGMTCASCGAAVRVTLKRLDGVREAEVSFGEQQASVTYDRQKVAPEQMIEAIAELGYQARIGGER